MPDIPSDGIIPKWQSLPYAILSQIFAYAFAAELETEDGTVANRRVHHPNTWILRTARKVCHDFAEPALTAFYQSPKLLAHRWLEDLTNLVEQPQESLAFKYKMKIKFLEISSMHLESKANESLLPRLIGQLPQLSELIITHPQDEPPFELRSRSVRWKYPLDLFDVLDRSNTHLTNWRWNWHLLKEDITGQPWVESNVGHFLNSIHKRSSFQSIQHLTISHLPSVPPFPELIESEEDPAGVALAEAICILPDLKSLSFESCDCLTNQLLQGLPDNLEKLKIVNCATLTSDMLYDFLARNESSNLVELVLDHNPFLDLAFLASLRRLCPKLQVLKMDLYDHRENYFRHFGEPKYEQLLLEDELPTWPSTLRTLELVHLHKWGAGSAQNLFKSLVDSADSLLDLRTLVLQAHINISWRDRAAFRDQWIERLQRVYLRQAQDPSSNMASLKSWRMWKESQRPKVVESAKGGPPALHGREVSHVLVTPPRPLANVSEAPEEQHNSDNDAHSNRRSKRISDQVILQAASPPEEPEASQARGKGRRKRGHRESDAITVASDHDEQDREDWRDTPEKFIQGLCSIVDIRIDNQRPREEQFNESHFLDSEASGDEEWTEGAEAEEDGYAW
ncbi:hypothetical protein BDV97DRAFT_291340 [Delphinella strobiligena]|nr:hypothetical protein BDV97DRAFT_291340 [Delphinella strobiligena]